MIDGWIPSHFLQSTYRSVVEWDTEPQMAPDADPPKCECLLQLMTLSHPTRWSLPPVYYVMNVELQDRGLSGQELNLFKCKGLK